MRWARETHGIRRFIVSISPDNLPSLGVAANLGFRQIGTAADEVDCLEYVFELAVT
jgi:ribosomal-protein-alanine N-acetyltransferase